MLPPMFLPNACENIAEVPHITRRMESAKQGELCADPSQISGAQLRTQ
jgi:hypothetical protein